MRKRIIWQLIENTLHSTNTSVQYVINSEMGVNTELEDEPRWRAFRRESNVDSELYFGYNLAKALRVCETDEVVSYFPYIQERLSIVEQEISKIVVELDNLFFCYWDVASRKKYAEHVKSHPFSSVLFSVYGKKYNEVNIRSELVKFEDKIIDYIERKF